MFVLLLSCLYCYKFIYLFVLLYSCFYCCRVHLLVFIVISFALLHVLLHSPIQNEPLISRPPRHPSISPHPPNNPREAWRTDSLALNLPSHRDQLNSQLNTQRTIESNKTKSTKKDELAEEWLVMHVILLLVK